MMYIDIATKQEVYVCSDSSCAHNNIMCTSVFEEKEFGSDDDMGFFIYNGSLYILTGCSRGSGGISSREPGIVPAKVASLYRMGLDGSNRDKLFTFGKELRLEECVIGDGDNLWFCVYEDTLEKNDELGTYYEGMKNRSMVKLSLSDRVLVEQIPIADRDNVSLEFLDCIGDKMIFSGYKYPDGMSKREYMETTWGMGDAFSTPTPEEQELDNRIRKEYFTLDLETKVIKKIYLTENKDSGYFPYNGAIYVYDGTKNVIIDPDTGKTEDYTAAEGYTAQFVDHNGKFICYQENDPNWTAYYFDPDTGELTKEKEWQNKPGEYVNVAGLFKDKVLIQTCRIRGWRYFPSGDGKFMEDRPIYGVMSLEDYNDRVYNVESVKMLIDWEGEYYGH